MSKRMEYWFEHHPVASNSILCLNLWVLGDFMAQYSEHKLHVHVLPRDDDDDTTVTIPTRTAILEEKSVEEHHQSQSKNLSVPTTSSSFGTDHLDLWRTAQCASYGAFVTGPILALWYPYMDRICNRYKLALKYGLWAAPIAKVAADEFLMDPPTLVLFFGYMTVCEGGTLQDFNAKLQTQFFPSWCTSLAVWPVVLLGTFRFLPVPVQAPVINVCCIAWDAFLSHRNALAKAETQTQTQHTSMGVEPIG
jgi:protein Mpv17